KAQARIAIAEALAVRRDRTRYEIVAIREPLGAVAGERQGNVAGAHDTPPASMRGRDGGPSPSPPPSSPGGLRPPPCRWRLRRARARGRRMHEVPAVPIAQAQKTR